MSGILLDTHAWLWTQRGQPARLSPGIRQEIETQQKNRTACISAFSAWEIAQMVSFKGFVLGETVEEFLTTGIADGGLKLLDVSASILIASMQLPGELHRDPADRILIATARELGLTLITADKQILRYAETGYVKARKI